MTKSPLKCLSRQTLRMGLRKYFFHNGGVFSAVLSKSPNSVRVKRKMCPWWCASSCPAGGTQRSTPAMWDSRTKEPHVTWTACYRRFSSPTSCGGWGYRLQTLSNATWVSGAADLLIRLPRRGNRIPTGRSTLLWLPACSLSRGYTKCSMKTCMLFTWRHWALT